MKTIYLLYVAVKANMHFYHHEMVSNLRRLKYLANA